MYQTCISSAFKFYNILTSFITLFAFLNLRRMNINNLGSRNSCLCSRQICEMAEDVQTTLWDVDNHGVSVEVSCHLYTVGIGRC